MHTTQRWATSRDFPQPEGKGPNGRGFCRWCHQEVPKGRRTFCGDECLDTYWIRVSGTEVRRQLELRDHGVCHGCGMDAGKLERIERHARRFLREFSRWTQTDGRRVIRRDIWFLSSRILEGVVENPTAHGGTLWQPDHILPVAEGGGMCGLSNYRTLCTDCHIKVTARQARRKSKTVRLGRKAAEHQRNLQLKWQWATD